MGDGAAGVEGRPAAKGRLGLIKRKAAASPFS